MGIWLGYLFWFVCPICGAIAIASGDLLCIYFIPHSRREKILLAPVATMSLQHVILVIKFRSIGC